MLKSDGFTSVVHYFPDESVESVVARVEASSFFRRLQFQRIVRLRNGAYAASMPSAVIPDGDQSKRISSIHVVQGKLSADQKSIDAPSGASVILVPGTGG